MIDDCHQQTAHEPAGGIAHSDGDDFVADVVGHHKQIDLPEKDKRAKGNKHGHFAVAGTPQRTAINLIYTAQNIKRGHPVKDNARSTMA